MLKDKIICGDAIKQLKKLDAESVDLVLTDPPYLVNYQDRTGRKIANDTNAEGVLPAFGEIYRVLKSNSLCICFCGWTALDQFTSAWSKAGFHIAGHIVWTKPYASNKGQTAYHHESAYVLAKGFPKRPAKPLADVQPWIYSGNRAHPTEKSVETLSPLVRAFSKPGDLICDPFAGSGSTCVSAALTGRHYLGIELENKYCRLAQARLAGVERYKQGQDKQSRSDAPQTSHETGIAA